MAAPGTPEQQAAALAARQHAVLSVAQVRASGMSYRQAEHRVATGRWRRPARGIYVVAGSPDTPDQRAMIAFLSVQSSGGVLSHVTAAWRHGLLPPSPIPHVTVPPGLSPRSPVARVHRSTVPAVDRARRDGVVLTSPSRTIVDVASLVDRSTLEGVVDDAFCRRLATAGSVAEATSRLGAGRCGLGIVREVIDVWRQEILPGSVAEVRLLRQLGELGVDMVTQHEIADPATGFVARLDVAAPALRWGLEYDGRLAHNPRRWERDESRYERLRTLGWTVDSVGKLDLLPGARRLRDLVAARVNPQHVWVGARAVG